MKLSIVVPCYNEEESLPYFIRSIQPVIHSLKQTYEIELIFIDDGSTDGTSELLEIYRRDFDYIRVIIHDVNKNIGSALRTAFSNFTGDIIITTDSDGTYPPEKIMDMVRFWDDSTDMIIASPYHPQGGVEGIPKYRLFLSRTISLIYCSLLHKQVYTFTALFRMCTREVVEHVNIESDGFLGVTEWTIDALHKGYRVREFPTILYVRKYGQSKIKLLSTIKSHCFLILKLLAHRLRGESHESH